MSPKGETIPSQPQWREEETNRVTRLFGSIWLLFAPRPNPLTSKPVTDPSERRRSRDAAAKARLILWDSVQPRGPTSSVFDYMRAQLSTLLWSCIRLTRTLTAPWALVICGLRLPAHDARYSLQVASLLSILFLRASMTTIRKRPAASFFFLRARKNKDEKFTFDDLLYT
jgi:hypothetical protein